MAEDILILKCNNPDCGKQFKLKRPAKGGIYPITCPYCKNTMKVNIPAPPQAAKENEAKEDEPVKTFIVKGEQNSLSFLKGKIEVVKKWGFNKTFHLSAGSNIIGRHDTYLPSDISIKDDACVSRRSVDIQVESTPKGNLFKLKVLKSTNPVYVNNEALCQGDTVSLNFGDIIILGKTQLRFLKDT